MDMSGEYRIAAPKQRVWEALNDTEILRQSIPGCEAVERLSATEMSATVTTRLGVVKATFRGKVTLSDINPPHSYTISGEGQGGVAGFGKGSASVELVEDGEATVLKYVATAQVGGKLAQIGQRLIDTTAKKLADEFFSSFTQHVGQAAIAAAVPSTPAVTLAAPPEVSTAAPAAHPPHEPDAAPSQGAGTLVWIALMVAAVIALLVLFAI